MELDDKQWQVVNQLLDEALKVPAADRDGWLATLDVEFQTLVPTLHRLLANDALFETRDIEMPALQFDSSRKENPPVPSNCGPYNLIRPLGSGGMGSVWLAQRIDGVLARKVALKLPHAIVGSAFAERSVRERNILSALNHPNIARLYDAGVDTNGQSYLALEYVEGLPIVEYCIARSLSMAARIELFLDVVDAVAYAHGQLVIHRDLKPANILVTNDGGVRLLDFGIAKLLEEGQAAETDLTRVGGRALTLAYASPEQVLGSSLGVASDIYSLGVLLYELLTGRRPYDPENDSTSALEYSILTAPPIRPSDAVPTTRESRYLKDDLDTILLKSLAKEPERRYATCEALGDDLRRFLAERPVLARPDTLTYRLRKFAQRHRLGVATAALTSVTLIGASVTTYLQSVEATQQRNRALYQQQRQEATSEFMSLLLDGVGSEPHSATMPELLDRGVLLLEQQYQQQPFLGSLYQDVASRYLGIGQVDRALELLERAISAARTDNDVDVMSKVLCQTGRVKLRLKGSPDIALANIDEGLKLLKTLSEPSAGLRVECARAEQTALKLRGDIDGAIDTLRGTLEYLDTVDVPSAMRRSLVLNELGVTYIQVSALAEALLVTDEAIELMTQVGRGDTTGALILKLNRSNMLAGMGELASAKTAREELLTRFDEDVGAPAFFQLSYAASLAELSRHEEALVALQIARESAVSAGDLYIAAACDTLIGTTLVALGRTEDALTPIEKAAEFLRNTPDGRQRGLIDVTLAKAKFHLATDNIPQARQLAEQALSDLRYPVEKTGLKTASALRTAASVSIADGDGATADLYSSDALAAARALARDPDRSANVGRALVLRARAKRLLGDARSAAEDLKRSLAPLSHGLGETHPEVGEARTLAAQLTTAG